MADGLRWWCSDDEGYDGDEGDVGTKVVVDRGGDGRSGESVVMDGSGGCDDDGGGVGCGGDVAVGVVILSGSMLGW
ncbi:hypothetical protein Tco_0230301 [Tanacetum coccineum]